MISLVIAVAVAASSAAPPAPTLGDAAHAIAVGRLEEAKLLIGRAMAKGASGPQVDRLLADLAFASGKNEEALERYQRLIARDPKDSLAAERGGLAALKLGMVARALPLINQATASPEASWRAWNARGVIADLQSDWDAADSAYARAAVLAPGNADIENNRGWSLLIRGEWQDALPHLERAAALNPKGERIANNLELARAALANGLPQRHRGESASDWAARLNDAGVAAELTGNRVKAIAAFTQALEASETWYTRAANNLAAASGKENAAVKANR